MCPVSQQKHCCTVWKLRCHYNNLYLLHCHPARLQSLALLSHCLQLVIALIIYHPHNLFQGPVLRRKFNIPRISFCYLDSLTLTIGIRGRKGLCLQQRTNRTKSIISYKQRANYNIMNIYIIKYEEGKHIIQVQSNTAVAATCRKIENCGSVNVKS